MHSVTAREKRILAKIFVSQFSEEKSNIKSLSDSLETGGDDLSSEIDALKRKGLLLPKSGEPKITPLGRSKIVVVLAGGSFDIIHPGHLHTLEQAKALGDALVVSVARDKTFKENKKREPHHSEVMRRKLVSALRSVDAAVLGSESDILETAILLKPDIIALGYDQSHNAREIKNRLMKRGVNVRTVRLKSSIPEIKTTSILSNHPDNSLSGT